MFFNTRIFSLIFVSNCVVAMNNPAEMKALTPSIIKEFPVPGLIDMQYTPDGKKLLVNQCSGGNALITLYDTSDYTPETNEDGKIHTIQLANANIMTVTPDSKEVVIGVGENNLLARVNLKTRQQQSMSIQTVAAQSAQYSADGKKLLITISGGVSVIDVEQPNQNAVGVYQEKKNFNVAWNPVNPWQVGISVNDSAVNQVNSQWSLWDIRTPNPQNIVVVPPQLTTCLEFSNDGTQLISGAMGQMVVCDTKTAALAYYSLNGKKSNQPNPVEGEHFLLSPVILPGEGTRMFVGDAGDKIYYYDLEQPENFFSYIPLPQDYLWGPILALSTDGKQMASSNYLGSKDKSRMQILDVSGYIQSKKEIDQNKVEKVTSDLTDNASQVANVKAAAAKKCLII